MKVTILFFSIIFIFVLPLRSVFSSTDSQVAASKKPLSISELLQNHSYWDQRVISLTGEVIGQPLLAQDLVCIHILDHEGNAIGVWMEKEFLTQINYFGRYCIKGDIVNITGIFNLLCSSHSGDTDVHASNISVSQQGVIVSPDKPIWSLFVLGWILLLYPGVLLLSNQVKKFKQHK
ncbi:MAG: hypothetical protein PHD83_04020 [Caldisericia bacterium]|nr:hypothetical protein [Caldisericia bacterium]